MKRLNVLYILILLSLIPGINAQAQKDNKVELQGPEYIKQVLFNSGVLVAPDFVETNKYDAYKAFDNIKGLFFNGLPYKGKSTQVFCWYGVPKTLSQGQKAPAVVLVHGGGGTAFPQWVKKWNDKGYIAISIALEGQIPGEKIDNGKGSKEYQTLPTSGPARFGFFNDVTNDNLQDQWFYHAVSDVILAHSLLRSFPEVDTSKIGITGISWGGILTNVVTGIDDRFAFSIPVYGCGFLHDTPLYKKLLSHLNTNGQEFYLNTWEPSLYVPLQNLPTLFVNGTNDKHFTMNSFTKTYEASKNEKYLYVEHEMKHGHGPGWTPKEIYHFADYIIKDASSPIKISLENKTDDRNNLTYSYNGNVKEAELYYTTDAKDWDHESYKWLKIPAVVIQSDNIIKIELPKKADYFFINVTTPDGLVYSSSMEKVKCSNKK